MAMVILFLLYLLSICNYLLFGYAIMSWLPALYDSAIGRFIRFLAEPILKPFRRFNLAYAGLDFTVFVAMIALQVLSSLLSSLLW